MVLYCELCDKGIYGKVLEYPRKKKARLEDAFEGRGLPPDEALVAILGKGNEAQNRDGSARKQPSNRICNGPRPNERNCSERCATAWKLWRPQVCGHTHVRYACPITDPLTRDRTSAVRFHRTRKRSHSRRARLVRIRVGRWGRSRQPGVSSTWRTASRAASCASGHR